MRTYGFRTVFQQYLSSRLIRVINAKSIYAVAAAYLHQLYRFSREGKSWEDFAWEETRKWLSNLQAAFAITAMEALNSGSSKITIEYDPNSKFDMIEKYGIHYELKNGPPTISNSVGTNLGRNVTKTSELNSNMLKRLKNERTINAGGRSGGNRPLTGTPNSYGTTSAGHTLVYNSNGRLIYDISPERVKMTV